MTVLLVYKKSQYELYRDSPDAAVKNYARNHEESLKASHDEQERTLETVLSELQKQGFSQRTVYRAQLPEEDMQRYELIVSVGGDGTFLEVSHYVQQTPLLGVNSDPNRSVGFFCCATQDTVGEFLQQPKSVPKTELHRLHVLRDGVALPEPVLNDVLFAHVNPAANTRFTLEIAGKQQAYRGSGGLLVCTAAGSTAWMKMLGGHSMPLQSKNLQYKVRDVLGEEAHYAGALKMISQCREGKLYIDGEHLRYDVGLDQTVELKHGMPLTVLGDLEKKRERLFT